VGKGQKHYASIQLHPTRTNTVSYMSCAGAYSHQNASLHSVIAYCVCSEVRNVDVQTADFLEDTREVSTRGD
jgi:hypothetical protein